MKLCQFTMLLARGGRRAPAPCTAPAAHGFDFCARHGGLPSGLRCDSLVGPQGTAQRPAGDEGRCYRPARVLLPDGHAVCEAHTKPNVDGWTRTWRSGGITPPPTEEERLRRHVERLTRALAAAHAENGRLFALLTGPKRPVVLPQPRDVED